MTAIIPVLLAGGNGSRLWPLGNADKPKQFLSLAPGEATLFQQAAQRALAVAPAESVITVTAERYAAEAEAQLTALHPGLAQHILAEPSARNTAAACAMAAFYAREQWGKDSVLLILPCDHVTEGHHTLAAQISAALPAAAAGRIILFGAQARSPSAHYGYIVAGKMQDEATGQRAVRQFVEKPEPEIAARLLAGGACYWNSGIYCLSAKTLLEELAVHAPHLDKSCAKAFASAKDQGQSRAFDAKLYDKIPALPFDRAVAEKSDQLSVLPARFGWADVGSFESLRDWLGRREPVTLE